jgi:hypothetical protein
MKWIAKQLRLPFGDVLRQIGGISRSGKHRHCDEEDERPVLPSRSKEEMQALVLEQIKQSGLTTAQIARESGVSKQSLYALVNNRCGTRVENLVRLLAYFGDDTGATAGGSLDALRKGQRAA